MSRQKEKGTRYETAIVRYLREVVGDETIDRMPLHGNRDEGDVRGLRMHGMRVCVEVKNRKEPRPRAWMCELAVEKGNADAEIGMLIVHRDGCGDARLGMSWCYMTLGDVLALEGSASAHDWAADIVVCMELDDALALGLGGRDV